MMPEVRLMIKSIFGAGIFMGVMSQLAVSNIIGIIIAVVLFIFIVLL